jgi:hypothetical protein
MENYPLSDNFKGHEDSAPREYDELSMMPMEQDGFLLDLTYDYDNEPD